MSYMIWEIPFWSANSGVIVALITVLCCLAHFLASSSKKSREKCITATDSRYPFLVDLPGECKRLLASEPSGVVKCVLLGRDTIITSNADWMKHFMVTKAANYRQRMGESDGLRSLGMLNTGVIWNNNSGEAGMQGNTTWTSIRKIFADSLTSDVRRQAARIGYVEVDNVLRALLQSEPNKVEDNSCASHDIQDVLRRTTLRITLECFFGVKVVQRDATNQLLSLSQSYVDLGDASSKHRLTEDAVIQAIAGYFKAWHYFLLRSKDHFDSEEEGHLAAVKRLREVAAQLWRTCSGFHKPTHFIQGLKALSNSDAGPVLEHQHQCCLEMLLAGTDTSSVTLFYAISKLASDQTLQRDLRSSIIGAIAADKDFNEALLQAISAEDYLPDATNRQLDEITLRLTSPNATALSNYLYEVMRVKPVGPVSIRQAVETDVLPDGTRFPAGGHVIVHLEGMHQCPMYFPEPNRFDMFRELKDCEQYAPFGKGLKSCLGRELAMAEMCAILASLLLKYHVSPTTTVALEDMEVKWDIANQPTNSKTMIVSPRRTSIILCGASSTGKSKLAATLHDDREFHSYERIKEVARTLMDENGWGKDDLKKDKNLLAELQVAILDEQLRLEKTLSQAQPPQPYISDRGLDPLAYAEHNCLPMSKQQKERLLASATQLSRYHQDALVLMLEPVESFRREDQHRILDSMEGAQRFNTILQERLISCKIPLFPIPAHCTDLEQRKRLVKHILHLISAKHEAKVHDM